MTDKPVVRLDKLPWMPLCVTDYIVETMHLDHREKGIYMDLLIRYWRNGGLPDDDAKIATYLRLSYEEWMEVRPVIADLFQSGWKHERTDHELRRVKGVSNRMRNLANKARGKGGTVIKLEPK
jgi:uncharacterized protein YdaU (DUF1376 family)